MNGRSFGSLFGPYLGGYEISPALASGQVENMDMDHGTGRMRCTISFNVLVPPHSKVQLYSSHTFSYPDLFSVKVF